MFRPFQPYFNIQVNISPAKMENLKGLNLKATGQDYYDITQQVVFPVVYEEQASLLNTLTFTVDKYADVLLYLFHIGQSINFYGGYYTDNASSMQLVFAGTVTRIRTQFTNSGHVSFTVECMNYGFTKLGKDHKNFTYPDDSSSRTFASADSLTLSQIVKGIAEENNMSVGILELTAEAQAVKFTKDSIRYQKDMTDWQFLNQLAQDFGCSAWISLEDDVEKINFVSNSKAQEYQSDITFLYPLQGQVYSINGQELTDDDRQTITSGGETVTRYRIIRDVQVDEDISMAYAVTRSAVYYNKETGEYETATAQITEDANGNRKMTFYTLDEQRVQEISESNPALAEKIRNGSPTGLEWGDGTDPETASYYYKVTEIYDENTAVFDKAFFGIYLKAKCNQDLNIRSQRTYKVHGLLTYHSQDKTTSFFLRGLKHIWDRDGTWTELDMIR